MRRLSLYLFLVFVFAVPWQDALVIGGSKTVSSLIGMAALVIGLITCLLDGKVAKPPAFVVAFAALCRLAVGDLLLESGSNVNARKRDHDGPVAGYDSGFSPNCAQASGRDCW